MAQNSPGMWEALSSENPTPEKQTSETRKEAENGTGSETVGVVKAAPVQARRWAMS